MGAYMLEEISMHSAQTHTGSSASPVLTMQENVSSTETNIVETKATVPASSENLEEHLKNVEEMAFSLKKILVSNQGALNREDNKECRQHIEVLERWMESYRKGLAAANKISSLGPAWLAESKERLKLALTELQRLEGEGGNLPSDSSTAEETDSLSRAVRHLEKIIPALEEMFKTAGTAPAEKPIEEKPGEQITS
jgi:hypothetical protein